MKHLYFTGVHKSSTHVLFLHSSIKHKNKVIIELTVSIQILVLIKEPFTLRISRNVHCFKYFFSLLLIFYKLIEKYLQMGRKFCTPYLRFYKTYTARKTIFAKFWNIMESSKRPTKYHILINFLAEKKTMFLINEKFSTINFC